MAKKARIGRLVTARYERQGEAQTLTLPLKLDSRANFRGHTRSRGHVKAIREQRGLTCIMLRSHAVMIRPPVRLKLVRIAPCRLDPHENLPMCFKSVVDGVADWLGIDDREGLVCEYGQEKASTPGTHGCRITIEPL